MKTKLSSVSTMICIALPMLAVVDARGSCGQGAGSGIALLPTLGGSSYQADALNEAGDIVGFSFTTGDFAAHAFLFTSNSTYDLGTLGGSFGQGFAVNNLGIAAGEANTAGDLATHAFLLDGTNMIDLGTLGGAYSGAVGINDSGVAIGNSFVTGNVAMHGFVYSNGVMTSLGTLGGNFSLATAINQAGVIIGDSYTTNNLEYHAYVHIYGTMVDLGTFGGTYSSAFALSEAGVIVGEASLPDGNVHGFIFEGGAITDVGTLGGTYSSARAINDAGQVAGIATIAGDAETHGFVYSNGSITDLGTLGGTYTEPSAINNHGQIVGYSTTVDGMPRAFLWQNGTMTDLGTTLLVDSGWELLAALFINDAGRIVGYGYYNGAFSWFVLDLNTGNAAPVAVASADPLVECPSPVSLDGSGSSDPDGDALLYAWTEAGFMLGTNATLTLSLDPGTHVITLMVTDPCGASDQTDVIVQVVDTTAPVILSAPTVISLAADANCQAAVPNVLASLLLSDNCAQDQLSVDQNPAAGTLLQGGNHLIAVTVADPAGNVASTNILLTIADGTAPVIHSVGATPNVISPANNRMVGVTVSVAASDNCDSTPDNRIVSITANEPVAAGDIQITGNLTANLAATRNPSSEGRIYTITVESKDASGNTATATTTVTVPKGNGNGNGNNGNGNGNGKKK